MESGKEWEKGLSSGIQEKTMIEIVIRKFLEQMLSVPVFMEFPENPPDRFVILKKGDTTRDNWLETATFILESYGTSMMGAAKLNQRVKNAMDSLTDLNDVSASDLAADYPSFDEKNKRYRYQAVYNVTYY